VRAREKVCFLRYNGMRSNRYFVNGIEGHIFANPDLVAHRQIPLVGYPYTQSDENELSDLRANKIGAKRHCGVGNTKSA
jgi:hypothetical protein